VETSLAADLMKFKHFAEDSARGDRRAADGDV
jgi:hypothetical protein